MVLTRTMARGVWVPYPKKGVESYHMVLIYTVRVSFAGGRTYEDDVWARPPPVPYHMVLMERGFTFTYPKKGVESADSAAKPIREADLYPKKGVERLGLVKNQLDFSFGIPRRELKEECVFPPRSIRTTVSQEGS